jgi:hypothetical protein
MRPWAAAACSLTERGIFQGQQHGCCSKAVASRPASGLVRESFGEECAQLPLGGTSKPLQYIQRMALYGRHRKAAAFEFCTIHDASPSSSRVSLGVSARAGGICCHYNSRCGREEPACSSVLLLVVCSYHLAAACSSYLQALALSSGTWPAAHVLAVELQYEGAANHWWLRPCW